MGMHMSKTAVAIDMHMQFIADLVVLFGVQFPEAQAAGLAHKYRVLAVAERVPPIWAQLPVFRSICSR